MEYTTAELAEKLGANLVGDAQLKLYGMAPIEDAKPGDLAFLANKKYFKYIKNTKATAVIVPPEISSAGPALLVHPQPYYAYSQAVKLFYPEDDYYREGIHKSVIVGQNCRVHPSVHVGANVVLEDEVVVGKNTRILPNCFLGRGTKLGGNCLIYANVVLREKTEIGNNVIIHSGTTIGSDGFGYVFRDGEHHKIAQVGRVVIEDDVEIGANCAIDRAALGETRIGKGTKIDNLVQIAHNVKIGENCIIISQVGISGSTRLGNNVILAGQAGLVGHIQIADNVIVAAQSGVKESLEDGKTYLGSPAREVMHQKRIEAIINKLPEYLQRLRKLEEKFIKQK